MSPRTKRRFKVGDRVQLSAIGARIASQVKGCPWNRASELKVLQVTGDPTRYEVINLRHPFPNKGWAYEEDLEPMEEVRGKKWFLAKVLRLVDDGPPVVVSTMRFPSAKEALDWARSTFSTYLELGETSLAVHVSAEIDLAEAP